MSKRASTAHCIRLCTFVCFTSFAIIGCSDGQSKPGGTATQNAKQSQTGENSQTITNGNVTIKTGSGNNFSGSIIVNGKPLVLNGKQVGETTKGSGNVTTEQRDVKDFLTVSCASSVNVTIVPGDFSCSVTTDDNIHTHIITQVENRALTISPEGSFTTNSRVNVKLSMPKLKAVSASSTGSIHFEEFKSDKFTASSSSSGKIHCKGSQFGKLDVQATSSGSVACSGTAKQLVATASSSGNVDLKELNVQDAVASATSSGRIIVAPTNTLKATSSSSGSIKYRNQPGLKVNESTSSSGSVKKL